MIERTYTVTGMACGNCESFVTEELMELDAVTLVSIDLANDAVTVTSQRQLEVAEVREAVEQAGYELASDKEELAMHGGMNTSQRILAPNVHRNHCRHR